MTIQELFDVLNRAVAIKPDAEVYVTYPESYGGYDYYETGIEVAVSVDSHDNVHIAVQS